MNRFHCYLVVLGGGLALIKAAEPVRHQAFAFEKQPRISYTSRSPKFVSHGPRGLEMLSVRSGSDGQGYDLFLQSLPGASGGTGAPVRVNNLPGEVSDHGENSPQVVTSPDQRFLYAAWGSHDPKDSWGGSVRFARSSAAKVSFSPAVKLNDDNLPISYAGFQTLAVGPDGIVYVAWIDGREGVSRRHVVHDEKGVEHSVGDTSALYLARSVDNGQTFGKNIRIAGNICPCCRPTIAFINNKVVVGWRQVDPGDIRDIYIASSSDQGRTWGSPAPVGRDGWKINGCPHVGPSLAALGSRLYVAWLTQASGESTINVAFSEDGGKTFSPKRKVSEETVGASHPQLVSNGEKLALVFQARSAKAADASANLGVYYREIYADGSVSPLALVNDGSASVSYPSVQLDGKGQIFIGWTQTDGERQSAYLVRGRPLALSTAK